MDKKYFDISGKVIILTGGMGMLGKVYAKSMASCGSQVILLDIISEQQAAAYIKSTGKYGKNIHYYKTDISRKEELIGVRNKILKKFGKIDGLINNAAITARAENLKKTDRFEDFELSRWNKDIAVNVTGTMLCCQIFGSKMKEGSSIINISSTYGIVGPDQRIYPNGIFKPVSYSVSKGAVVALTKYLATTWGPKQIRVNCVVPGGVQEKQSKDFIKHYSYRTPLGRMAKPEEYVGLIIYLISSSSSYCTGGIFVQDGGWTAW